MAFVIAEPCVGTCDQACVQVCPIDCIHGPISNRELEVLSKEERKRRYPKLQLYIDPNLCIDCGSCVPECPVDAIFEDTELPPQWEHYAALNAQFFR